MRDEIHSVVSSYNRRIWWEILFRKELDAIAALNKGEWKEKHKVFVALMQKRTRLLDKLNKLKKEIDSLNDAANEINSEVAKTGVRFATDASDEFKAYAIAYTHHQYNPGSGNAPGECVDEYKRRWLNEDEVEVLLRHGTKSQKQAMLARLGVIENPEAEA